MTLFHKRSTLYFLLISTVIMIVLMFLQGRPLKTAATQHGILSLEFAFTQTDVESIVETWEEESPPGKRIVKTAIDNTRLDFIFLCCYALFLFTAARQLSVYFSAKKNFYAAGYAALLAGLLDVVENIGMLKSLHGSPSNTIAFTTATAAYFKWVTVLAVIFFLLVAFVWKLLRIKGRG